MIMDKTLHCFRDLDLKEGELDDKSNEIGRLRDSIKDIETSIPTKHKKKKKGRYRTCSHSDNPRTAEQSRLSSVSFLCYLCNVSFNSEAAKRYHDIILHPNSVGKE
ncbi:Hypothetical predicted protein [Mytilus galloprovincialis]|uniref:C2H2-type domain-containing protein n=1 Tax=Mytilus galloprovincialis TaxID=29158 RepID=A0A8B6GYI7_MYTGA|nr:Hypothetical predicted protein [Mytilus galloprovincialis]